MAVAALFDGRRGEVAIWWTEDDIAKVARQVLASDVGRSIVRQHIEATLRDETTRAIGAEMRAVA